MENLSTIKELKCFSKQHRKVIIDMYVDGIKEHQGNQGVVFIELDDSGEVVGFGYNILDRRKLKFINLSFTKSKWKNLIAIYWIIIKDGEKINAVKELFKLPLVGEYSMME